MDGTKYAIAYDIPENRRRTKVHKILEGFADAIQFSVFEAEWQPDVLARVMKLIERTINKDEDKVRIYTLCANCKAKTIVLGKQDQKRVDEGFLII